MSDRIRELRELLAAEGIVDAGIVDAIAADTEAFDGDRPDLALEALEKRRRPGRKAEIVSKRTGNLLVNWRDLVTKVLPTSVLAAGAAWANPFLGVFSCLALLRVVGDATEVTLSDDHAKVVSAIWEMPGESFSIAELRGKEGLAALEVPLDRVLDDLEILKVIQFKGEDEALKTEHLVILPDC